MKAIRVHECGGPEVLKYEDVPEPRPGPGQVLVRVEAMGVNYTDVNTRAGANPPASFPWVPGLEAAGVVTAVGEGVTEAATGDRVAYPQVPSSYAEQVVAPAARTVKLPQGVDSRTGAAAMMQGMTAHYLAYSAYPLKAGDRALIHAGAGGVGLLLIQMARRLGAHVFATVSTDEKAALAKQAGANEVIVYTREDFEEAVKKATGGAGVQVVYDSVGQATFQKSLNCLAPRGFLALYGQASGPVPPMDTRLLSRGGNFLTRPSLTHYTRTRDEFLQRANDVLGWIKSGRLKLRIHGTFPMAEAREAHRQLQGRLTAGKLLLVP
jgi:NADPH2:quinone reductase